MNVFSNLSDLEFKTLYDSFNELSNNILLLYRNDDDLFLDINQMSLLDLIRNIDSEASKRLERN